MSRIDDVERTLRANPLIFVVTGGAGFIGSHLVARLVALGQNVRVVDDLSTGKEANLAPWRGHAQVQIHVGDVCDGALMQQICTGAAVVLHQAALGSVPRSLADPRATHRANVDGFVSALLAARDAGVRRFVYASSSSVYGDHPALPKQEHAIGRPLSPYAVSKLMNEISARIYQDAYGIGCIGLRYFNVFGPRQDPDGPYAAVIPRFAAALRRGEPCTILGDGETSRDFCYVDNAVQANLLAALADTSATNAVYNVAFGERTTLTQLFTLMRDVLASAQPAIGSAKAVYGPERPGDVRHSLADIARARDALGYAPTHDVRAGLRHTLLTDAS